MVIKNPISLKVLTPEEKAYIIDNLTNSSYYQDLFGNLDAKSEEKLIISIFSKLQKS
jgi:hypothetical protein